MIVSHTQTPGRVRRTYISRSQGSRVADFGGEGSTIILLHGFLASSRYWKKLQPYLSDAGFRVIAIDLLGFGKAPKPKHSNYSYDEHISYLHKTIRQSHIHSPVIMIGHSMGALLAMRYGRMYPADISRLVLLHPPLYEDSIEARATIRGTNRLYRFLLDSRFRRLGWIIIKTLAGFYVSMHGRHARERSLRNIIEKAEAFDDLTSITVSTLLVIGSKDRAEYLKNVQNHVMQSNTTVKIINTDHHSPIRESDLIQYIILSFIAARST